MKTLFVLRHAKSSWSDPDLVDHDRPLKPRGRRDAPRMGRLIQSLDQKFDLVLSSSAVRARETAIAFADAAGYKGVVELDPAIYDADPDDLVERLAGKSVDRIVVVGHNPTMEGIVEGLTGHVERMPTAALAIIQLDVDDWSAVRLDGSHKLDAVYRPKELDD